MTEIPKRVSDVMSEMGRKGAKARAKKYSTKDFSKWGKKGGRPLNSGNPDIKRIMEERGVTRQRAHQILNGDPPKSKKKK